MEGDGGAGAERPDTLVTFLLYYSRSSWMISLDYVIYRKMTNLDYTIYHYINRRSGLKHAGCARTPILLSLHTYHGSKGSL